VAELLGKAPERFTPCEIVHLLLVIGQYMMLGRIMATTEIYLDPTVGAAALQSARDSTRSG
jgi:hypothetical protein